MLSRRDFFLDDAFGEWVVDMYLRLSDKDKVQVYNNLMLVIDRLCDHYKEVSSDA